MVAGHVRPQGVDTRARILSAAVELFAERGYAGTSVRDISERLGVTKAALYYHFSSKETILDALISPFVSRLGQLVELARQDPPPPPRVVLEGMVALLVETGGVLCAFANDPSVLHRRIGKDDITSQQEVIVRAIAGADPTPVRMLRARCAIGCIQSGVLGAALERVRGAAGTAEVPGAGRAATDAATSATTTGVGIARGIQALSGFTGCGGAAVPNGAAVPASQPGTPAADGIRTAGDARPVRTVTDTPGQVGQDRGVRAPGGVGALSPLAPLLPTELQRVIVEAALAALGPERPVDPPAR
ncbi:TetR/AcrR family transcriptional regulator [Parafrankia discariae]|uniref:TetR/AcrR family transcriptional regulator n=1 Tax=Parafrankia discariae TaxID=365528 RepID=UPI0004767EF1|nr:TetR/AcrR family transcriptional regulator [Parafrankia discariae]